MQFEYPLQWPVQQPRTKTQNKSKFGSVSIYRASEELFNELRLLGAKNLVISSNLQQRMRGDGFLSNQRVEDAGIAIYSNIKGEDKVMACDRWDKVEHNIWALCLSVKAIRGLERWGGSEFLDGLFSGFKALPAGDNTIQTISYFEGITTIEALKAKYRELAMQYHPDRPDGNIEKFKEMKTQYENLLKNLE
jgi:hypothetical protein